MVKGVEEISEGLFRLTLPMPFRLEHINVYAAVRDGKVSLIDTGPNMAGVFPALEEDLALIGRKVSDVDQVFITHYHGDHCGLAGPIQEISGAKVFMEEREYNRIAKTEPEALIGLMEDFYKREGMPPEVFGRIRNIFRLFRQATLPFAADRFLTPGEGLEIKGLGFEVISTPGHTAWQVVFFCRERGLLFSGDHVLPHITPNLSPDLANPSFRPLKAFLDSLDRIKDLPAAKVFPAHGRPLTDLKGRIRVMKAHHEERKALILESIRSGPKSTYQVSCDIFGADISDFDKFLALNETYVHIIELEIEGLVTRASAGGANLFSAK